MKFSTAHRRPPRAAILNNEMMPYRVPLFPTLDIPHYLHERWYGAGYPYGISKEDIPLAARIFAVVDVYDALTTEQFYRKAWPEEKARE